MPAEWSHEDDRHWYQASRLPFFASALRSVAAAPNRLARTGYRLHRSEGSAWHARALQAVAGGVSMPLNAGLGNEKQATELHS